MEDVALPTLSINLGSPRHHITVLTYGLCYGSHVSRHRVIGIVDLIIDLIFDSHS